MSDTTRAEATAVVIGAGITGLHQLYELRMRGIDAVLIEAGGGVGGTWYWNRYPGCRFDVESYTYQYFFSDSLLDEWSWTEEFAAQPETERYLNMVVDKFDLRKSITLNTRVDSMTWSEEDRQWELQLSSGSTLRTRFVVTAIGVLSALQYPKAPGLEDFEGEWYHTGAWPSEPVDFHDKRVAVIGTGSSGVQVIPAIVDQVSSLTVFQRSPNWAIPLNNAPISPERSVELRSGSKELYSLLTDESPTGYIHLSKSGSILDLSEEEQTAFLEDLYQRRGMAMLFANYADVMTKLEANQVLTRFLERKIRERVEDQSVADLLVPDDHSYGAKRPPQETNYYEVFNEPHVTLVSLRNEPIERFTPRGVLTSEREIELDIIVLASGFDAVTGPFLRMDIAGKDGRTLREDWADGPHTYLGMAVEGYPNMFMAGGAQSTRGNFARFVEPQVLWIARTIEHLEREQIDYIEATQEASAEYEQHILDNTPEPLFLAKGATTWSRGTNVADKPNVFLLGVDSLQDYRGFIDQVAAGGYSSFTTRRCGHPESLNVYERHEQVQKAVDFL